MKTLSRSAFIIMAVSFLAACAGKPRTLYGWGSYPEAIYETLSTPEQADPQKQIKKLESDIQKAYAKNQAIPPGLYAHLAYQYLQTGQTAKAVEYLTLEKQAFPESAVYIDSLIRSIK